MFKRYLITGLLVLVPLVITVWVLKTLLGMMDQSLLLLPYSCVGRRGFSP